jgi:hypothetical protein
MMDKGTTNPSKEGRELINQLVESLSTVDPSLACELTKTIDCDGNSWYGFIVEGNELARVNMGKE